MNIALQRKRRSAYIGKDDKKSKHSWAGRLAWLGHLLDVQKVAGPNPVRPTTNYLRNEARIFREINFLKDSEEELIENLKELAERREALTK